MGRESKIKANGGRVDYGLTNKRGPGIFEIRAWTPPPKDTSKKVNKKIEREKGIFKTGVNASKRAVASLGIGLTRKQLREKGIKYRPKTIKSLTKGRVWENQ